MGNIVLITHKVEKDPVSFGLGGILGVRSNYARALKMAGLNPLISAYGDPESYADLADGVVFSGGRDFDPARYGEVSRLGHDFDEELDDMEWAVFEAFMKRKKPILGICRGIQTINVALGGTLYQDIATDTGRAHVPEAVAEHTVVAEEGSTLFRLFGPEFQTNTYHHQAVKDLGEGLVATGRSKADGIIEAVEHKTLPIMGIQWHPERMIGEEATHLADMRPVFDWFARQVMQKG